MAERYTVAATFLLSITLSPAQTADTCVFAASSSELGNKDALLHGLDSEVLVNYGNISQLPAIAWTFQGIPGVGRSILEFPLGFVPPGSTITEAYLSLYAWDSNTGMGQHSDLSGSNAAWIQRVTSNWNENTVTWNTQPTTTTVDQVGIAGTSDPTLDYPNIDVTALVQDMVDDPANSHGFLLRMQEENFYRRLNFCSSDHPNVALRPTLEVCYAAPTSIAEDPGELDLLIFPSPASDQVRVELPVSGEPAEIMVSAADGRILHRITTSAAHVVLDVNRCTPGWYAVRVHYADRVCTGRFLVAR